MIERAMNATVGEIVASDFRAASVFERFGIDFCCGGRRSLEDACRSVEADPAAVIRALDTLPSSTVETDDVTRWPLTRLIEHIESTHHAYVRSASRTIGRSCGRFPKERKASPSRSTFRAARGGRSSRRSGSR